MNEAAAGTPDRRRWMAVLARASRAELEAAWSSLAQSMEQQPAWQWLRRPETGLAMVRARAGGSGAKFNLGEASITRCALRTAGAKTGIAYILGRDPRRAELAALFDALMQDHATRARIEQDVVAPLAARQASAGIDASRKAAATRVDFYTMVRGENP